MVSFLSGDLLLLCRSGAAPLECLVRTACSCWELPIRPAPQHLHDPARPPPPPTPCRRAAALPRRCAAPPAPLVALPGGGGRAGPARRRDCRGGRQVPLVRARPRLLASNRAAPRLLAHPVPGTCIQGSAIHQKSPSAAAQPCPVTPWPTPLCLLARWQLFDCACQPMQSPLQRLRSPALLRPGIHALPTCRAPFAPWLRLQGGDPHTACLQAGPVGGGQL